MPSVSDEGEKISFLDTNCKIGPEGNVEVNVHRKATHTNKYLAFDSHNPAEHKRAVVISLMNRASEILSNTSGKEIEKQRVMRDLEINGYPSSFIKRTCEPQPAVNEKENGNQQKTFAIIPYVKGVSERVARILGKFNIKTAFKPVKTLGHIFKKPKDRPSEWQVKGIVYKSKCKSCPFTYIGESKRSWNSPGQ